MIMTNNKGKSKKLSYIQYKRRQRCAAIALLLITLLFMTLGFIIGYSSKETYTIYHVPDDNIDKEIDEIFPTSNQVEYHLCQTHTHQVYEEVISCEDGSVLKTSSCIEVDEPIETASNFYVTLTEDEKHMLACLIYLEGRGESIECQTAIGSVVLNRYTTSGCSSLKDIIYAEGQFTPAYLIDETEPTITQIQIVNDLCMNGPSIPEYVTYFRANKYHTWSSTEPYIKIDNTYFSASKTLQEQMS